MRGMITGNWVSAGRERDPLGGRRPREARGLGREELGVPLQENGQVMYVRGVRPYDAMEFRDAGLVLIPRNMQIEAHRVEEDVLHCVYTFGGDGPLARQDVAPRRREVHVSQRSVIVVLLGDHDAAQ